MTSPHQVFQNFRRSWAEDEPRKKNLAFSMTKRTFLRPSDHRGWVLLCFAFYLLSQLIRGTTPTQEVLNSIPSTSSSIHFNTQISFPVAPCARYPIWKKILPAFRTNGTYFETWIFFVKVQLNNCCLLLKRFDLIFYDLNYFFWEVHPLTFIHF